MSNESTFRVHHGPHGDFGGMMLLVTLLVLGTMGLFIAFSGFPLFETILTSVWVLLAFLAIASIVYFLGSPRFVLLDHSGIRVQNRLTTYSFRWDQLTGRTQSSLVIGEVRLEVLGENALGQSKHLGLPVSLAQARAIIQYPLCPKMTLPPRLRRRLGVA